MKKFLYATLAEQTAQALVDALNSLGLEKLTFALVTDESASVQNIALSKDGEVVGYMGATGAVITSCPGVHFYGDEDGEFVLGGMGASGDQHNKIFAGCFQYHGVGQRYFYFGAAGLTEMPAGLPATALTLKTYYNNYADPATSSGSSSAMTYQQYLDGPAYSNCFARDYWSGTLADAAFLAWPWVFTGGITCDGVYACNAYDPTAGAVGETVVAGGKSFVRLTANLLGILN